MLCNTIVNQQAEQVISDIHKRTIFFTGYDKIGKDTKNHIKRTNIVKKLARESDMLCRVNDEGRSLEETVK